MRGQVYCPSVLKCLITPRGQEATFLSAMNSLQLFHNNNNNNNNNNNDNNTRNDQMIVLMYNNSLWIIHVFQFYRAIFH